MNIFIKLVPVIFLIIFGCTDPFDFDDPQNFCVRVFNDTDREVSIYYAVEDNDYHNEDVIVNQEKETIHVGDHVLIEIQAIFWDGELTAEYGGILNIYEVDEEFLGCRDIHIEVDDFIEPNK